MKVAVSCAACLREFTDALERGEQTDPPPIFLPGDMHDSGAVFVKCPKGHESAVVYNHHKYEILFSSGTAALEDGYANEAVSTMAAALERAFEFYFRVICRKRGLTAEQTEAAWKPISRQSERQFGAFSALWLLETQQTFPLPSDVPEFRNEVIHRGYIPSIAEVREFAEKVFILLKKVVGHLQMSAAPEMSRELLHEAGIQNQAIPNGMLRASMAQVGINDVSITTFDQWVEKFREMRSLQDSYRQQVRNGAQ